MKNNPNNIFSETKKVIIFIHSENQFIIDESVMSEAVYIKLAKEGIRGTEKSRAYYLAELRKAAKTDKPYIVMEFEPFICDHIESMMRTKRKYYFWNWNFIIFFHADSCPQGEKPNPMYNLSYEKLEILWPLYYFPIIIKYTLPVQYVLEISDLQNIMIDLKAFESTENLWDMAFSLRQPAFPFYEINRVIMRNYIDSRIREAMIRKKMECMAA